MKAQFEQPIAKGDYIKLKAKAEADNAWKAGKQYKVVKVGHKGIFSYDDNGTFRQVDIVHFEKVEPKAEVKAAVKPAAKAD